MRRTLIAGLGLAVVMSGVAAAQQPGNGKQQRDRGGARFERRGGAPDGFLLRGIALSDDQKARLKEMRKSDQDAVKASRESLKAQRDEMKAARQRGDTAAVRSMMKGNREIMARVREQRISAVRAILTPEQRVQFDQNLAEAQQRRQERVERGMQGRGKRGDRGPRSQRGPAA